MNKSPIRREEIMERQVGKEQMLYDVVGRVVHVLNETAYFIWKRCDGQHTIEEIVKEACAESSTAEDVIRQDVEECMALFRQKGLLQT